MEKQAVSSAPTRISVHVPISTLVLNDATARLRLNAVRLLENHQRISRDYPKVSVGGLLAENKVLAGELNEDLERFSGLCWNSINEIHPPAERLSSEEWAEIASSPPAWLKTLFTSATVLNGLPSEESLDGLEKSGHVMVLRDESMRSSSGLMTNYAALMPLGLTSDEVRLWWPWVMGGNTPVMLKSTEKPNVLLEFTVESLHADEKLNFVA